VGDCSVGVGAALLRHIAAAADVANVVLSRHAVRIGVAASNQRILVPAADRERSVRYREKKIVSVCDVVVLLTASF
jgi:hypothetical protein